MNIDLTWFKENIMRRDMGAEEQEAVTRFLEVESYDAGAAIIAQNQPGGRLYILRSGRADVVHEAYGTRARIAIAEEGALFGELTFLTGEPASAHVVARDTCVVYTLLRKEFSEVMQQHQELAYALFAHMLEHTAQAVRHMNEEHAGMMQYIMGRKV